MLELNNPFSEILKNDRLPFEADPSIEQRLMYHFQFKTASSKIKRNQSIPFVERLFSTRLIGLKIGLATLLVVLALGFKQFNSPKQISLQADTASVYNTHDTVSSIPSSDSISVY
jgi:hypothetical protein